MKKSYPRRLALAVTGLLGYGLGIYLTLQASIGVGPWDVLALGIAGRLPLSYGDVSVLICVVLLVIDLLLGERIGLGTVMDALIVGKSVDLYDRLGLVPVMGSFWAGAALMVAGLFVMALSQWLYMSSALCCGPRDSLLVALGKRVPRVPIGLVANALLLAVLAVGWLLGGPVGWGTVISGLGMGLAMQLVFALVRFEPRDVVHEDLRETLRRLRGAGRAPS